MMITQRTAEWYMARRGKPTGSNAWKIMATKKDGAPSAERVAYMVELVTERLTGAVASHNATSDMQRGIDLEPEAIRAYEIETGLALQPGHWVDMEDWGCTPDAFVEDDGLLSVKCPRSTTIVRQKYFLKDHSIVERERPPEEYYWQAVAEMVATGRKWCDLLRYDNRFIRKDDRYWVVRIKRNQPDCDLFVRELTMFIKELDSITPVLYDEQSIF